MVISVQDSRSTVPVAQLGIEAIFFDMNGTLRERKPHESTQHAAVERFLDLLKIIDPSDAFWEELTYRYKAYGHWAQENLCQLSEKEIWTHWLLPDIPPCQIEPVAEELTLAWKERNGLAVPKPGADETLKELKERGYLLGVISNSISSLDIPRSLETFGWLNLFEVVILSSTIKYRKPAPEIFWEATRTMNVEPPHCAFIGNRISRDVAGCKGAGFALGVVIEPLGEPGSDEDHTIQPDAVIHSLHELLDIFPRRVQPEGEV